MNVGADLLFELAQASGAPLGYRAEGVVRHATERLKGEREYHLEVLDGNDSSGQDRWTFVAIYETYAVAQAGRTESRSRWPASTYRIVELLRRVLP